MSASRLLLVWLVFVLVLASRGEEPVNPFGSNPQAPPRTDARPGVVSFSDGKEVRGLVMLSRGVKLELFEDRAKRWRAFELPELSRLEVEVESEKVEKEWRFKEAGNDEKLYTGRTYVDRKLRTTVTLADGKTRIAGQVKGTVLYVETREGEKRKFFLYHDQSGAVGQTAEQVVYIKSVVLEAPLAEEKK